MYLCFEKAFIKDFCKTLTEIDVFSTYIRLTNISNVYHITLKYFVNVLNNAISIYINVLIIYSSNFNIVYLI